MSVNNVDTLPNEDVTHQRQPAPECWQRTRAWWQRNSYEWHVVNFEPIRHVTNAIAIVIRACHDNHFMPSSQQALREIVDVNLNATESR